MINDLNLLNIFYNVALENSVSKAANKLHISQPAVSQNIKLLEEQLGISLFFRTNKGVKLTDKGKILYNYSKEMAKHYKKLKSNIGDSEIIEQDRFLLSFFSFMQTHGIDEFINYVECSDFFKERYGHCDGL